MNDIQIQIEIQIQPMPRTGAPLCTPAGLGMSFDVDSLDAPGATGSYDTAFHAKAAAICDALTAPDGWVGDGFGHRLGLACPSNSLQ